MRRSSSSVMLIMGRSLALSDSFSSLFHYFHFFPYYIAFFEKSFNMEKNESNQGDPVAAADSYDDEKQPRHISDSASDDAVLSEFSRSEEKRIIHRIDRRLVLTVGFMYCISLMDRTNLSAANIAG
jgi:hypothetical protein